MGTIASEILSAPKLWTSPRAPSRKRMICSSPSRRSLCAPRMAYACVALLFATSFLPLRASAQDNSQDVAEAARQQKARKAAQSSSQTHVYTNEDLQRARILTDTERTAVATRKGTPAPAAKASSTTQPAETADGANTSDGVTTESLGEVARRYRQQKAAREAAQAQKGSTPAPYHLDIAQPALATVVPRSSALGSPVSAGANTVNLAPGTLSRKRDPFSHSVRAPAPVSPIIPLRRAARPNFVAPSNAPPRAVASGTLASRKAASPTVENLVSPAMRTLPVPSANISRRATKPLDAPDGKVTIRVGDSLWNLSRKYFGSGIRWQQWLASNPEVRNPRRIQPGMRLIVPQPPVSTHATAATLVIHSGDSLWKVAASQYGNGASWPCLLRANPSLRNPAMIFPGQRLLIPATCTEAPRAPRTAVSNP
jgi:nucleoid-associated protein YgaU